MTLIDLSGEIPADPFDPLLQAWADRDWDLRGITAEVEGWEAMGVRVAGFDGWLLERTTQGPIYGSGESFVGLDLAGRERILINRETNGAGAVDLAYLNIPFVWSESGWGLIVWTGAPVFMDFRENALVLVIDPTLNVTSLEGSGPEMLGRYAELTGAVPEDWPDWAFGTWMSRATYLDVGEMLDVVEDLRAAGCPVDVIHVDAWMTGNVFRDFTTNWDVDRSRFPNGWTDDLRARGARVSMWLNPFIKAGTALADELLMRGFLVMRSDGSPATTCDRDYRYLVDFTNPRAVEWWQRTVADLMRQERPDALKLDFAEEVPPDAVFHDGRPGHLVRNSYAALYQQATRDVAAVPMFCRSGWLGAQRTPCHWVGDTPASWDGLAGALNACLSLSASGVALVATDGGGFHSPGTSGIPATLLDGGSAAFTAEVEPELYGRWAQFAAFTPVTRFHGLGRREPTAYPGPWGHAAIAALQVREGLRPHLRSALAAAHDTGLPVMRPMVLMTDDPEGRSAHQQYFLGEDILVAPLLTAGGHTRIWMPEGSWVPLVGEPTVIFDSGDHGWADVTCGPYDFPAFVRM